MKSRARLFIVLFFIQFLISGCWSRYEVESLAIVGGMGIDMEHKNGRDIFLLTTNIIRPSLVGAGGQGAGNKGRPVFWRMMAVGSTISEAEKNLNLRAPRRIFYGHVRFVIIGESMARKDMNAAIDYLQRNKEIRARILVLVVKGKASDTMDNFPELENTIAKQVEGMETIAGKQVSKFKIEDLVQVTDEIITPGIDPVIAQIINIQSPPTEPGGPPLNVFEFAGGGVMRKEKLVGWLEEKDTFGYLLAVGKAREGVMSIKLADHPQPDTSVLLTRASSKIKVKANDGQANAIINIRAEGDLAEYHGFNHIATNQGIHKVEDAFNKEITKQVTKVVQKAQKLNADIFGFGSELHQTDPQAWRKLEKDWYKVFPKIEVKVNVVSHIRRTGFIANPYVPE